MLQDNNISSNLKYRKEIRFDISHQKYRQPNKSQKCSILGLSGDKFHFDVNGDGPARYNILHFKQVSRGVYNWVKVGQYLDGELQLHLHGKEFELDF